MATTAPYRSRIVGHEDVAPTMLAPSVLNARRHPRAQHDALDGALGELGWIQSVIVSKRTGNILDGHLRVELALSRGEPTVPVVWVDVDPAEEAYALATMDPLSALAQTDAATLEALLAEVSTEDAAVQAMLDGLAARNGLGAPFDPSTEWQGMPGFEHEDQTAQAAFTISVFLKDSDDLSAFSQLLGKDLTGRKFVWFSKQPHGDLHEVYDEMPT